MCVDGQHAIRVCSDLQKICSPLAKARTRTVNTASQGLEESLNRAGALRNGTDRKEVRHSSVKLSGSRRGSK